MNVYELKIVPFQTPFNLQELSWEEMERLCRKQEQRRHLDQAEWPTKSTRSVREYCVNCDENYGSRVPTKTASGDRKCLKCLYLHTNRKVDLAISFTTYYICPL